MSPSYTLDSAEMRMLEQIKRKHTQWPYARWVLLFLALGLIAVGIYIELGAIRGLRDTSLAFSESQSAAERSFNGSLVFLSCLATKNATLGELLRWCGILLLLAVVSRWRGNPVHVLLLALIAQRNERATPIPGPA
jgi:hypothetical protein